MKTYILHFLNLGVRFKLVYKSGKFFRLERISGFLNEEAFRVIGRAIPPTEKEIQSFQCHYADKIEYEPVEKKKSLYNQFVGAWFAFYNKFGGHDPRFNAAEGRSLKQIINYLKKIAGSEKDALELWQQLLQNWQRLDDFHQRNTDLKYINGNINRIIENVKRGSKNTKQYSEDFKQSIIDKIQSE